MFAYRHEKANFGQRAAAIPAARTSDLRFFILATLGATSFFFTLVL